MTALHYASYNGYKDIVELLLSHPNIDINIRNKVSDIIILILLLLLFDLCYYREGS